MLLNFQDKLARGLHRFNGFKTEKQFAHGLHGWACPFTDQGNDLINKNNIQASVLESFEHLRSVCVNP